MMDNHVVGTAQQYFGLSVTIPVVAHSIVLLIRARDHVGPQVDVPQAIAFQVVAFQQIEGCSGNRASVNIVTLHDELAHAVAIHISQGDVVDAVVAGDVIPVTVNYVLHGKLNVLLAQSGHCGTLLLFHAAYYGCYLIRGSCRSLCIGVVRYLQRCGIQLHAVSVQVVLRIVVLFTEDAPAHEGAASRRNGYQSAIQLVGRALCVGTRRKCQQHGS